MCLYAVPHTFSVVQFDIARKNRRREFIASNGKEYTVVFICKSSGHRNGYKKYDIYEAANKFDFSKNPPIIAQNATTLGFESCLPYYQNWNKILARFSEDDLMEAALELAPKNQLGELTKNRVVRLVCNCIVSDEAKIEQLITKAKDGTTLEILYKARLFDAKEIEHIEQDYFATHPELWCE